VAKGSHSEFYVKLEELGEAGVRIQLSTGGFGRPGAKDFARAKEWLFVKDQTRKEAAQALILASSSEANRIVRNAKNAARAAALAAIIAAICAIIAITIAPHSLSEWLNIIWTSWRGHS
jgi:hypothetical protein